MTEKGVSFCCNFTVEDSLELRDRLKDLDLDYLDSKEITVTETAESEYLESVEFEFTDNSKFRIDIMDQDQGFRYHTRFRTGEEKNNFDRSERFLSELYSILNEYGVSPHFMTISTITEEIESNLPSDFSLETSDYQQDMLQVSQENKKFGFIREDGSIEFYIRVENYEDESFNSKKAELWNKLEEWMNS